MYTLERAGYGCSACSKVYDEPISERERSAASALASLSVEGIHPSMYVRAITDRWVRGKISTAEMRERVGRLYGVDA